LRAELPRGVVIDAMQVDGYVGGTMTRILGGAALDATLVPGDVVTFSTTGGVVPSFSGTVVAPPTLDDVRLPTSISRSIDLTLTWSERSADRVSVVIMDPPFTTHPPRRGVWCVWAGTTSTVAVSRTALATFQPGDAVMVSASLVNVTPTVAGDYAIDLEAAQFVSTRATIAP
jgi:hypothetical protein